MDPTNRNQLKVPNSASQVVTHREGLTAWQMWKLVPVRVGGPLTPSRSSTSPGTQDTGSLPSYEGDVGQSSTHAQRAEFESDEFGTVVNEVTVVVTTTTSTVTTRKKYRVEDA